MYNCYFGDCFKIENSNGNDLLVDFGIYPGSSGTVNPEDRFDDIFNDLSGKSIDFLLSHYHEDHYNGVVYINDQYGYKFDDVYIPDIWKIPGSIPAVSLHLLKMILDRSKMGSSTTLFSFLNAICKNHSIIHFVKRGMSIQEQYIALWPDKGYVTDRAEKLLADIQKGYGFSEADIESLSKYSKDLIQIVLTVETGDYQGDTMISRINDLEQEFLNHKWDFVPENFSRGVIYKLHDFGNNISIVFQNIEDKYSDNLLFTGDFGNRKRLWNKIERNFDKNSACEMHPLYHAIKVGHHGTRDYYHSYAGRIKEDSYLLIPNDGENMNWPICSDYSLNAVTYDVHVICSTANLCEARAKNCVCTCTKKDIIDPGVYLDIY